jgi:flagellar biosynthesis/type III secretory pathway chaperone
MELEVSGLLKILNQQNSLIEELCGLADEQLQALKRDDLDKIKSITSHQEYIRRQMAVLEERRRLIIEEYSRTIGVEIKHFSELMLYTSSDDLDEIQRIRDEIIDRCQKLKEENELNALLLKQGLKYTEKLLGVLNPNKSFVYGKSGDVHRAGSQGIVDTNV